MPKMPLSSENKAKNSYEFPKLFLEKGERARIVLLDPVPQTEYVHTMRAPQITNGKPVPNDDDKSRDPWKMDFIGRHICIGNFDTIADKGVDVKQCPVCAEAKKSDAVKPPERRHALNVIRYKTQPGSFAVQNPFQVELVVWSFGDGIFNKLVEFADEWGDLRAHDLMLGPCEVKQYQKMDYNVAGKAEWLQSDDRKALTTEVFKNNMLGDLTMAIGRKLTKEQVLDDLSKVLERHAVANGKSIGTAGVQAEEVDVSGILEEPTSTEDTLGTNPPDPKAEPSVPDAAEEKPAEQPKKGGDDLLDLEDILSL